MNPSAHQKHTHRSTRRTHEPVQPAVSGYGPDDLSGVNPYAAGDLLRVESETAADKPPAEQLAEAIRRLAAHEIGSQTRPADARSLRVDPADSKFKAPSGSPGFTQESSVPEEYAAVEPASLESTNPESKRGSDARGATAQTVEMSLEALEALQQAVRDVSLQNKQLGQQNLSLVQDVLRARQEVEQRQSGSEPVRKSEKTLHEQVILPSGSWTMSTDTASVDVGSVCLPPIAAEDHPLMAQDWIPAAAVWFNDERWEPEIVGYVDATITANSPSPVSSADPTATTVVSHRLDPAVTKAVPDPRIQAGTYITATSDLERLNRFEKRKADRPTDMNPVQQPNPIQSGAARVDAEANSPTAAGASASVDEVDVLIGASPLTSDHDAHVEQPISHRGGTTTNQNEPFMMTAAEPLPFTQGDSQKSSSQPTTHDLPRVQAAWEVDYFRWPEVTHRLLRDEGQSLDTLLQSLHAIQRNPAAPRIVLVTGTRPSEGRSTLAISLARRAAARGQRTLLVDGDLHRGQLEQAAGLEFPLGWKRPEADDSIDECLVRSLASNLYVMPQGESTDGKQTRAACYDRLWRFIDRAAHGFDSIFVDAGLVDEFIDYTMPAPKLVDTALLVQGGVLGEGQSIVEAYRCLIHAGIKSIAVAETFGKRMAG